MAPNIALLICFFFIVSLFILDGKIKRHVSKALWLPTLWMMIVGTRTVAQWLSVTGVIGSETVGADVQQYIEGNPIDRNVYIFFIVIGVIILSRRNINWSSLFRNNCWLFMLIIYGGISIFWSDFPFVSLKRWIKSFGNIIMVLVVLTEENPVEAVKTMIKRFAFIFVPLSVVLIKYYPEIGRDYGFFDGLPYFTGATSGKNALGALCLVCGFFFIWDLSVKHNNSTNSNMKRYIIDSVILVMTIWLLVISNSATSFICLGVGVFVVLGFKFKIVQGIFKHGVFFSIMGILLAFLLYFLFGREYFISPLVDLTGHSDTFWGRTVLWETVIQMTHNSIIGSGFESFWLGDRLEKLWEIYWWHPNQAHNGYVEIYINLGLCGLVLLVCFIFSTYKKILNMISVDADYGRYMLGFFMIALTYNITEAAMKGLHFMWFMLLLCAVSITAPNKNS